MPTTATCSLTERSLLAKEAALASRVIHSQSFPREIFQWLSGREDFKACDSPLATPGLTASMNEILDPLLADARQRELKETRHAARWLAAVCRTAADHYGRLNLGIGQRILAASFLPLYRSLATGQLPEGLREARHRLAESLTLFALCDEVGNDLVQLLDPLNRRMDSPTTVLSNQFDIDLTVLAQVVRELLPKFDTIQRQFNDEGIEKLKQLDCQQTRPKTTDWAAPELLWKLAGELISQNSELVLPRTWIEIPVPWSSIADHWSKLSRLLNGQTAELSNAFDLAKPESKSRNEAREARTPACCKRASEETLALAAINELSSMLKPKAPTENLSAAVQPLPINLGTIAESSVADELAPYDLCNQRLGDESSSTVQLGQPAAKTPSTQTSISIAHLVIPKVLIAEIRSHNDPVFVKVISRQIAKCRTEERAISLVTMIVQPEGNNDHHNIRENGLALWQQRLVNWLADHPQIVEPHAFLTSEGELLLCLLDLERNETTTLVRNGLVEVLTGKRVDETDGSILAKVNVPARYHAGIASTSAPGSGFTAEQLIEPAVRCLSAASRHGKASIKSIEVF